MADTEVEAKSQRKSVAFTEGDVITDTNGEVTEGANGNAAAGTRNAINTPTKDRLTSATVTTDKDVDEVTEMFKGLSKKKKSKKSKDTEEGEEGETPAGDAEPPDTGDFDSKLAEAGLDNDEGQPEEEPVPEGDPELGTGIWNQSSTQQIPYSLLISRFFNLIQSHHPDMLASGTKSYKIPPPQMLREGNRKTVFANIQDISRRMKRSPEHLIAYLFAELGTSGSVDGSGRLIIKGRFVQRAIESVLRRYIVEYVTCKTCRSPDTELNKGENRLYFCTCLSCGSRRSVATIKTGFRGQVGRRKRTG
ncbi:eukaryotic translation initiation factor 2 beta subunit [Penicillium chermesinum]|uniref:Eukaryotic translation initiation factor 2 beta subunit n=1 Tax=Penicillium chermesinum TaxID=63820 RepID=A0A9W9NI89_9EURO|nr:eukaryotic translation initiation factor 2 beta subunit [Penicillium chermesinum]KAJ5220301.1 eukaryotic translation initiation factor 2 beta subunit [Penicillium chermesinum]KAJ6157744.1 eukaryotic translation initiation factor 2 beta subunit [Penicillium chermesinum]